MSKFTTKAQGDIEEPNKELNENEIEEITSKTSKKSNEDKPPKPEPENQDQYNKNEKSGKDKKKDKKKEKSKREEDNRPRIFLLEVILDRMQLSYCTEFMHRCYRGPNYITFRFLNQEPLTICENKPVTNECQGMKTGASSLFSLTSNEMDAARKEFIIDFQLFRDTPDEQLTLGLASLPITNLMKCVSAMCDANEYRKTLELDEWKQKPGLPVLKPGPEVFTESLHKTIVLMAPSISSCDEAALMSVYVRLSCFGPVMLSDCKLEDMIEDNVPKYVNCPKECTLRK